MQIFTKKQKANSAKELLDNIAFKEALKTVEDGYIKLMLDTKKGQEVEREYYHTCVNAVKNVKTVLTIFIEDGKLEDRKLQKEAKKRLR